MSRISHHGEYLDATPLGNCWLQDARHEAILEKEDEKIQEHNKGGKSRTETTGWSKTGDEDVDNTCCTSARLCPSSPLDVHPLQPRGRELLHSILPLHHSFINVLPWGLGFGQGKNMSKHKYMAEGLPNLPCLASSYWISEFQDGAFSLADRTFLVLDDFLVMIMIMTSQRQSYLTGRCLQSGCEDAISFEWAGGKPRTSTAHAGGSPTGGLGIGGSGDWDGWAENQMHQMCCLWYWWSETRSGERREPKHDHLHQKWTKKGETCANEMQH